MVIEKLPSPIEQGSANTSSVGAQVLESLKTSKAYRHAFVGEKVRSSLAAQIKTIREQRGMKQPELAKAMGKSQSWVSRLEDPNQPAPTIPSLLQVAETYDVDLEIRFRRFSTLIDDIDGLSQESLKVPSFEEELSALEKRIAMRAAPAGPYCNHRLTFVLAEPEEATRASASTAIVFAGGASLAHSFSLLEGQTGQLPSLPQEWFHHAIMSASAKSDRLNTYAR
jgi:transcriptional regulator with XRE-family HTH domain